MNYAIAVFAIVLVVSISFWFVKGRRAYMQTEESAARVAEARNREILIHEGQDLAMFPHDETEDSAKSDYKKA